MATDPNKIKNPQVGGKMKTPNLLWIVLIGLTLVISSCTKEEEKAEDDDNSDLSACAQTVLKSYSSAYRSCFSGDSTYGACETCGFYSNVNSAQGSYDCITCPAGYGIDVYFNDCTGYCVKKGSENSPISSSSCSAPVSCVKEQ